MNKRLILAVVIAVSVLVLSGCSSSSNLVGTKWSLVSLAGQPVLTDTTVTLSFEKDTLGGSDGCNSYSTKYTLKGSQISIDRNIVSTLMACSDPIMSQAEAFKNVLLTTDSLRVSGSQLTLLDARGQSLAVLDQLGAK
ncbi:MAG: META domain-containing protein [Anaerolineae bacterium]